MCVYINKRVSCNSSKSSCDGVGRSPGAAPRDPKTVPGGSNMQDGRKLAQEAFAKPSRGLPEAPKSQNLRMVLALSSLLGRPSFGVGYNGFCTFGSKARSSVLQRAEHEMTARSTCNVGKLLLASAPCALHLMPLLGSSSLFHASSNVAKTIGPCV